MTADNHQILCVIFLCVFFNAGTNIINHKNMFSSECSFVLVIKQQEKFKHSFKHKFKLRFTSMFWCDSTRASRFRPCTLHWFDQRSTQVNREKYWRHSIHNINWVLLTRICASHRNIEVNLNLNLCWMNV